MTLTDLVAPNAILPALKVNNKKQVIQELAARAAELTGQNERAILEILTQREKLGSTAVGNGVAIPHGKLPKLGRLFGLFARLERPVDFEALDGQPVDLVFLLLAPESAGADHLKALARVARMLRDAETARKLRESRDGFDGTWVAHPDLVPIARDIFSEFMGDRSNQLERQRPARWNQRAPFLVRDQFERMIVSLRARAGDRLRVGGRDQPVGHHQLEDIVEPQAPVGVARGLLWRGCAGRLRWRVDRVGRRHPLL